MTPVSETSVTDADKGSYDWAPLLRDDPWIFIRELARSRAPGIGIFAVALAVMSSLFTIEAMISVLALLILLECGPWNWPRQATWRGAKAVTVHDVIAAFLTRMDYKKVGIADGWHEWAGPRRIWPWQFLPRVYVRFRDGVMIVRGTEAPVRRLRHLFDSEEFKVLSREFLSPPP